MLDTNDTPSNLKHKHQTRQAKLQSKTNGDKTLPPSHTNNTKNFQPTPLVFPN